MKGCNFSLPLVNRVKQITPFVEMSITKQLRLKRCLLQKRVISALNFLSGEGIDYYLSGYNDIAIEVLINDYFNDGSASRNDDTNDDDSDHCHNQGNSH